MKDYEQQTEQASVLVLNRNWQAINIRTPEDAFVRWPLVWRQVLEIEGEDQIRPVRLGRVVNTADSRAG